MFCVCVATDVEARDARACVLCGASRRSCFVDCGSSTGWDSDDASASMLRRACDVGDGNVFWRERENAREAENNPGRRERESML